MTSSTRLSEILSHLHSSTQLLSGEVLSSTLLSARQSIELAILYIESELEGVEKK